MDRSEEDVAPRRSSGTRPVCPPIEPATVWQCESVEQADRLLSGDEPGFVYRRDGHPNEQRLGAWWRDRHDADWAIATSSGMAALAAVLLAELKSGDHVLLAQELYGKTRQLFATEASRLGISADLVDPGSIGSLGRAVRPTTRMLVVETISNPTLRVVDIVQLSAWCRQHGVLLVVDHTLATPTRCRPLRLGADYVVESLTKFANGHSDVLLGMVCGSGDRHARCDSVVRCWGMVGSPWDCWLAERGARTLEVRAERCCKTALEVARWLEEHPRVGHVRYCGLESHPDHRIASRQLGDRFGTIVTFALAGGTAAVDRLAQVIPFCPSLGEVQTTLSHPRSTSHRGLSERECEELGIAEGTVRLSIGCEPTGEVIERLEAGLEEDSSPAP